MTRNTPTKKEGEKGMISKKQMLAAAALIAIAVTTIAYAQLLVGAITVMDLEDDRPSPNIAGIILIRSPRPEGRVRIHSLCTCEALTRAL